jgi:hypothetical protein
MPAIYTIKITKAEPHIITMMKLVTTLTLIPAMDSATIGTEHSTLAICQVTLFKPRETALAT